MFDISSDIILRIIGGIVIIIGLSGYFGFWKRWYWRSQRSAVYGYPLLGIVCMLVSFEDQLMQKFLIKEWILIIIYIILLSMMVWFSYSPPEIIKPRFVKRIEQETNWVYRKMAAYAIKDNPWRYKAKNPKALDKWIREIKRNKK